MSSRASRRSERPFPLARLLLWGSVVLIAAGILTAIAVANRSVPAIATDAPPLNLLSAGDPAPGFSVVTTQGAFSLAAAKKPVLLEIFATWCPHCQRETAVLNSLYDAYKTRLDFVAVSGSPYANDRSSPQSQADVTGFADFFHVRYPIAYDPSLGVAKSYLQGGYPTIVIIGTDKRVAYIGSGEIAEAVLDAQIARVLPKR